MVLRGSMVVRRDLSGGGAAHHRLREPSLSRPRQTGARAAKRLLDVAVAAVGLVLFAPLIAVLAVAIKVDSRGPVFYRARRVGRKGREFAMLKFRKMHDGASGPALTTAGDERLTTLGRFLVRSKLDEVPQLWNVLKGDMSLVGPRPEDSTFVELAEAAYAEILEVRPGITGLSQLAFARESEILDPDDRVGHYVRAIFPQKVALDRFYASELSLRRDLSILGWTALAVVVRREVAVHRTTGKLSHRRRPQEQLAPVAVQRSEAA
jgi:lipopolysaccharide/colanic/teichoic acid biosynthesis glycosyltransferase